MTKKFLLAFLFLVSMLASFAQKAHYGMLEKAERYFDQYEDNRAANLDKLRLARQEADNVFAAHPDIFLLPKAQLLKGQIYDALVHEERLTRQDHITKNGESLFITAVKAFRSAVQGSSLETEKSRALNYYSEMESRLILEAGDIFEKGDNQVALVYFEEAIALYEVMKENKRKTDITEEIYVQLVHAAAHCATELKKYQDAVKQLQKLVDNKLATGATFEKFFELYTAQGKKTEADKKLTEGLKRFPEYAGLLFTAINQLLKQNRISELPPLLKKAIALEPDNHALYLTLGNVYDNLMQQAAATGKSSEAELYKTEAQTYLKKATEKAPGQADYWYSAGAFFYNQAAMLNKKLTAPDITAAQEASVIREMKALFDTALPFFQRAESLNPSDINTLIALKEIYARKDDAALSQEFSRRLKTLTDGGKIEKAYFK